MSQSIYNERYKTGYRENLSGYEIARWKALYDFIKNVRGLGHAQTVLDYGAGSGLFVNLWETVFPKAELYFLDISSEAKERFKEKYGCYSENYYVFDNNKPAFRNDTFDVVVSVEVMEHVDDLGSYLNEIFRILKPGGHFIWTTPCANRFSIEHIYSAFTRKIEQTNEGFRRWAWEDPTHLRRLRSDEIKGLLEQIGFSGVSFRFRSHIFSFICTYAFRGHAQSIKEKIMPLDYTLFSRLPNGASMIGGAQKIL